MRKILLFFVLLCALGSAYAAYPPRRFYYWQTPAQANYTGTVGACGDWWAAVGSKGGYGSNYTNVPGNTACVGYNGQTFYLGTVFKCFDGTVVSSYDSPCGTEWPPDPPPNPCLNNDTKNSYVRKFKYSSGGDGLPKDDGVCKITNPKLLRCYADAKGDKYCFFEFFKTTDQADPASPDDTTANPSDQTMSDVKPDNATDKPTVSPPVEPDSSTGTCPEGTVQIGTRANGDPICAGTGKYPDTTPPPPPPVENKPPVTTTETDGSTKTIQQTVQTNTDGSKTTTTTTTVVASDGSKSVSVTSSTSAGSSGQPGTADNYDKDKYDLCKQNPMLAVCRNSSVHGDCGAIVCEGDAVQCAALQRLALMQCAQKQDADDLAAMPQASLGEAVLSGSDPQADSLPSKDKAQNVEVGSSLDQTSWLGGGMPFADKSFTFQGQTVTIPFSKWVSYLVVFRYVIMVIASIVSFKILSGSFLRE